MAPMCWQCGSIGEAVSKCRHCEESGGDRPARYRWSARYSSSHKSSMAFALKSVSTITAGWVYVMGIHHGKQLVAHSASTTIHHDPCGPSQRMHGFAGDGEAVAPPLR